MLRRDDPNSDAQVFGAGAKLLRPHAEKSKNNLGMSGVDLMRSINDNIIPEASNEDLLRVRAEISENCEELIETGARIRPLMANAKQIGWVRGLHMHERKILTRWIVDTNDF